MIEFIFCTALALLIIGLVLYAVEPTWHLGEKFRAAIGLPPKPFKSDWANEL
jgi:hypothetical protein